MSVLPRCLVSLIVWSLFLQACFSPAVRDDRRGGCTSPGGVGTPPGFVALLLGWLPPYTVAWSANPLLLAGWILFLCKKMNGALGLGIAAALAGLTTWAFAWEMLEGYYLWQSSLASFALGVLVIRFWQPPRKRVSRSEAEEWGTKFVKSVSEAGQIVTADQGRQQESEAEFRPNEAE